jgi:membrane protease YdiL (CAAX protease family)
MTTHRTPLREIVAYLGIAYSLALTVALALPDANINKLLSVMVPTVTVGILTFTLTPKGSRRDMWRGIGLGRAGWRTWPAAIVLPFVLCAGAYGTAVALGVGRLDVDIANATPSWAIDLVLAAVIGTVFILGEEIGWRGYLLPRMQQLSSKRRAAVVTGFVHGCFHLPLILLATTYNTEGSRWVAAPVAVAVITAGGVFYAWIWDRAQSVWPVAIAHNTVNTVFELGSTAVVATGGTTVAYVAGETGFATLGVCVIAAAVLLRRARVWRSPASDNEQVTGQTPAPLVAA